MILSIKNHLAQYVEVGALHSLCTSTYESHIPRRPTNTLVYEISTLWLVHNRSHAVDVIPPACSGWLTVQIYILV